MTTLGPVSKLPPRRPCFAIFTGTRHVRAAMYEHLCEPVQLIEVRNGKSTELAVCMAGRASRWPVAVFVGTWTPIVLEETS